MTSEEKRQLHLLADHLEGRLWISVDELKRRIYFDRGFFIEIKLNGKIVPQNRRYPERISWARFHEAEAKCEEAKSFLEQNVCVKIEINEN